MRRLRLILLAFVAALIAFLFALPIVQADRCLDAGGTYDRVALTCRIDAGTYTLD